MSDGAAVVWSSSNPTVATVAGGVVTAIKVGTTDHRDQRHVEQRFPSPLLSVATQPVLRAQPGDGAIGSPLTPAPVVEIRDAAGNVATSTSAAVTVTIANGGGSLNGGHASAVAGVVIHRSHGGRHADRHIAAPAARPRVGGISRVPAGDARRSVPRPDSTTVSPSAQQGSNPAARTIQIMSGGSVALAGVTLDAGPTTRANPPVGSARRWRHRRRAVRADACRRDVASDRDHHASVRVNATGATNPAGGPVTLSVLPAVNVTYGSSTEKVRVLDYRRRAHADDQCAHINGAGQPGVFRRSEVARQPLPRWTRRPYRGGRCRRHVDRRFAAVGVDSVFVNVTRNATGPLLRAT